MSTLREEIPSQFVEFMIMMLLIIKNVATEFASNNGDYNDVTKII